MPTHRPERIAEMIHSELATRLRTDIKDPELTPISITRVEVPRDLGKATIFFLPLGGGEVSESLAAALDRAGRRLRGAIGRELRLRTAPELCFRVDTHHVQAMNVSSLLDRIGRELRGAEPVVAEDFDGDDEDGREE